MRAWIGLPRSVSRGTPVSSETSGDAYRNDPAASCTDTSARMLPASRRNRCSHGSGATPLPSTAFRCRFGTPTLSLSAAWVRPLARQCRPFPVQLARRELAEAQALEPEALVRGVEGVGAEREAAHDRGNPLLGEDRQERERAAQ